MKRYTLKERADFYRAAFPKWPAPRTDARWLDGVWVIGNDYRNRTRFYGCYPAGYLKRVTSLFPDAERTLHLFSGSLPKGPYDRFDIRQDLEAEWRGDAHELATVVQGKKFDLILADPPYSQDDQTKYNPGMKMINRHKVLRECAKILEPGGFLVWLDTRLPMFRKAELHLCGLIGVVRSTNHRYRMVAIFERRSV